MYQKENNNNFVKVFWNLLAVVLLLTFFSKSFYNYRLPTVSVSLPQQGKLSFTVNEDAEISYSRVDYIYAEADGRVREILVKSGDNVQNGHGLMKFEVAGTGEIIEIAAKKEGVITSVGVKEGMYVSSMQNTILYSIAELSEEWSVKVFLTEEQLEYVNSGSIVKVQADRWNRNFNGMIEDILSYADQSRTGYQAEIKFISENTEIAGEKAKVLIKTESESYDAIIPASALRKDAAGYYVLVLKKDARVLGKGYAASRMSVDLLNSDREACAVRGLGPDELVIVSSTGEITDGSDVFYEGGAK